ncbi:hypothetical protein ACTU3I_08810 [Microbacterium sp. RD1]|uniref:hypothetical protein n=1 Tax=Microbacterium sp. RD1 TaxID=3457313 RepID=UPI003FA5CDEA
MKRIDVVYDGQVYSVGGRDLADLEREIVEGLTAPTPQWLIVNDGEGDRRPAHLLLHPGIAIAVIPIPAES